MPYLHLSKPEKDRQTREENDRFREEVRTGQYNLFDHGINRAIETRDDYNHPGIVEVARKLVQQAKTAMPSKRTPGRKLILVLMTGGRDA